MHKKSMEAAECLKDSDDMTDSDVNDGPRIDVLARDDRTKCDSREKQEFCTESIAALRAKAQEHNAKLTQNISDRDQRDVVTMNQQDRRDAVNNQSEESLHSRRHSLEESMYRGSYEDTHSDMEIRVV